MNKLIIASVFTVLATGAFAQEAPYVVWNGQIAYTGQSTADAGSGMLDSRSMTSTVAGNVFDGGNINWDANYSGR